ncbi:MAG TPA: hypothetical protein V6D28_14070 [Leptolyngbyaceae cyanobacterium]
MTVYQMFDRVTQFFLEAAARIFGPTDDAYPVTGVQPFEGDPYKESDKSDW